MSDTPETNKAERMAWSQEYMVPTDFARKLERERNELKLIVEQLEHELDEARNFSDKQAAKYAESKSNTRLLVKQLVLQIERPAYTVDEAVDKMFLMESAKKFINEVQ